MKKVLVLVIVILAVFCLIGCNKQKVKEKEPVEITPEQIEEVGPKTDEEILEYLRNQITVVENRQDFLDESGDLLYYIQKDYLTTTSNDPAIQKIVEQYPKQEIQPAEEVVVRIYPDDVYYDTTTYRLTNYHNGILTIGAGMDWWWGSPHGYPSSSCRNFDVRTGEAYDFPEDIKDEIYEKAIDAFMEIAKENQYVGLLGQYHYGDYQYIQYLSYDEEGNAVLTDEQALRNAVRDALASANSYSIFDDRIVFYIQAEYTLSDWADRMVYSVITIPNTWNI